AAHGADLDEPAVLTPAPADELSHSLMVGKSAPQQLEAEADQESVIGTARSRPRRFVVAAVPGPEGLEQGRDALRPIRGAGAEDIGAADDLHEEAGVQQREQINDASPLRQAISEKARRPSADLGRQRAQDREAA